MKGRRSHSRLGREIDYDEMVPQVIFSIIIPFKVFSNDLHECLSRIARLNFKKYEVILLPDGEIDLPDAVPLMDITTIPTGEVSPAVKRDIGASRAKGEYLAFIDDDAYPRKNWLDTAYDFLRNHKEAGAIGGPAITPKSDPFWARVSGAVFLSKFSGGFPERYTPSPPSREINDWPSVNLIVRKDVFDEAGGFDSNFWPGEDTKLCRDIVLNGWKIVYLPELIVYHHRRTRLKKHLRQIGNYGYHRGMFARLYPETSRKTKYFLPSAFAAFILAGSLGSIFFQGVRPYFVLGLSVYGIAMSRALFDIQKHENFKVAVFSLPYIFLTHFFYGIKFLEGMLTPRYRGSLGR